MGLFSLDTKGTALSASVSANTNIRFYEETQLPYLKSLAVNDLKNALTRLVNEPNIYNGIDINPYVDNIIANLSDKEKSLFKLYIDTPLLIDIILSKLECDDQLVKRVIEVIQLKVRYG